VEQMQGELNHARDLLKLAEAKITKRESAMGDDLETLKRENAELKARVSELEDDAESSAKPMEELRGRILELEELLRQHEELLRSRDELLKRRESEAKELGDHAAQLQDQVNAMAESSGLLESQMTDLEACIDKLGQRLADKERDATELQEQVNLESQNPARLLWRVGLFAQARGSVD